jgi:FAD/FMN-containing dehydrogenase
MIGATIGAGVGPFQGLHGLIIDALRSVRLVTASGEIVTASDTQNNDLFWAVRGAGANFGVVVSATYEIYDAPNHGLLVEADFAYSGSVNASMWALLQSWDETYPQEMGLTLSVSLNRTTNQVHTHHSRVPDGFMLMCLSDVAISKHDIFRYTSRCTAMD